MFAMGMVHAGERGPGGGAALVADLGIAASYDASKSSASNPTISILRLTVKRNGTWTITQENGPGGQPTGGSTSGNWCTAPSPLVGDDFEVKFDTGAWQRLNSDRYVEVEAQDTTANNGGVNNVITPTIEIRKFGTTTPSVSDSTSLTASADYSTV